ncbi:spore coat protein CotJB [Calorimonas adulescens]|jgi:hypothetical protein|uniref:Spore coat protein CotJB n=1 Tax=Calorimonas adulescens TaxID=2606906 RepID=A0A5D8QA83_9THEO|nr:spore coat protein CotJB [Calorimonas adulescens]MDI6601035.1 spore coat protein CotJB [Thermoanaerobacteraceae bacterium]TZE81044.1 spore coat protein CotJB [Calorimonas adulescens]
MEESRINILKSLQEVGFAVIELELYLDTHPDDMNALAAYNNLVTQQQNIMMNYERMYGPLRNNSTQSCYPWQWINDPWPWEIKY